MLSCEFVTVTAAAGNDIDIVAVYSRFQEMKFPALYIHCGYKVTVKYVDEEVGVEDSINRRHGDSHKSDLAREEEKLDVFNEQ